MIGFQPELLEISPEDSNVEFLYAESDPSSRGAVFTRIEVVEFILDLVGWSEDADLENASLLEPSFGSGEFLVVALKRYLNATEDRNPHSMRDVFVGIEVNPSSFQTTRKALRKILEDAGFTSETSRELVDGWLFQGDFLTLKIPREFTHIVGNPPYVRQEAIPENLLREYRARFATMYDRADLYVPFFEKSLLLLEREGKLGFICSDRWMKNKYGGPLRERVSIDNNLDCYIDFTGCPAFHEEVVAYPAVTIIRRGAVAETRLASRPDIEAGQLQELVPALLGRSEHPKVLQVDGIVSGKSPWVLEAFDRFGVIKRLERDFPVIEDAGCKIGIGVATGADKVFIGLDEELDVEPERKLPLVNTRDIDSGQIEWRGYSVLNPFADDGKGLVDPDKFPKFKRYIEEHREKIAKRHVAKKNPDSWFKTIDRIYPALVKTPKLLIPDIKGGAKIVYDAGEYYPHHNLYYLVSDEWDIRALQTVLRSKVAEAFVKTYSVKMRGDCLRFQAQYLRKIRLPRWSTVPESLRKRLVGSNGEPNDEAVRELYRIDETDWKSLTS